MRPIAPFFWLGLLACTLWPAVAQPQQAADKGGDIPKAVSVDLRTVTQNMKEVDEARTAALHELGSKASPDAVDAREAEIKTARYAAIEKLMLKDTAENPGISILWAQLGLAQTGLAKYDTAEASLKKALEVDAAAKTPTPAVQGLANSALGELYARTGKVAQAHAAYDAAVKANPGRAAVYLRNQAIIFFLVNNPDAQVEAADEALLLDPDQPILYYLKASGLAQKATMDPATHQPVPPPGCVEAYEKYLQLAPNGPYAAKVKNILAGYGR